MKMYGMMKMLHLGNPQNNKRTLWLFAWYVVTFIENCFPFLFINDLLWHEIQHLTFSYVFPACMPKEKLHNMDLYL